MDRLETFAQCLAEPAAGLSALNEIQQSLGSSPFPIEEAKALLTVLGNSAFLRRWAYRNPREIQILLSGPLDGPRKTEEFEAKYRSAIGKALPESLEELTNSLLAFKYCQLFRISYLDLNEKAPLEIILEQLSSLANCIVRVALEYFQKQESGLGTIPFSVLALGKLGGNELNFSSDLDLIYLHGNVDGKTSFGSEMDPHEHFVHLSHRLTNFLNKKTPEGFLYRIDLDLRPEGRAGAIVTSLDAIEQYYEFFGAPWEKQALIKTGLAAGDVKLLEEFLHRIEPFVYSKTSDFSLLINLREMKSKIVASLKSQERNRLHLKLGDGGIREIEFFVQSLQLLYGGFNPRLRNRNTLLTIVELLNAGLIQSQDAKALSAAYRFLRKMEHRLQLVEEQQTHLLPVDPEDLTQLARRMGYFQADTEEAVAAMLTDLQTHRDFVKVTFQELLSHRIEE